MAQATQNLKNHTRLDPPFHFFLAPVAGIAFIASIVYLVMHFSWDAGLHVLLTLWALLLVLLMRMYPVKVQDRLIRLEERLRLERLLPEPLKARIGELSVDQLIGLRFASDGELAGLVEKTLAQKWGRKQIKQAIRNWRPDYWRV